MKGVSEDQVQNGEARTVHSGYIWMDQGINKKKCKILNVYVILSMVKYY